VSFPRPGLGGATPARGLALVTGRTQRILVRPLGSRSPEWPAHEAKLGRAPRMGHHSRDQRKIPAPSMGDPADGPVGSSHRRRGRPYLPAAFRTSGAPPGCLLVSSHSTLILGPGSSNGTRHIGGLPAEAGRSHRVRQEGKASNSSSSLGPFRGFEDGHGNRTRATDRPKPHVPLRLRLRRVGARRSRQHRLEYWPTPSMDHMGLGGDLGSARGTWEGPEGPFRRRARMKPSQARFRDVGGPQRSGSPTGAPLACAEGNTCQPFWLMPEPEG